MHANISWPRQYVQFTRIRRVYLISLTYVHSYPSGFEATTLIKAYVAWCILVFDSQSIKEEKIMEAEWTTNSHQICLKTLKNDSFDYYLVHKKFKYFRVNFWMFSLFILIQSSSFHRGKYGIKNGHDHWGLSLVFLTSIGKASRSCILFCILTKNIVVISSPIIKNSLQVKSHE